MLSSGDVRYWFQIFLIAALALAAWRWGAGPERITAGILVWFQAADGVNHAVLDISRSFAINTGHVVIDLVGAAVAIAVALYANRIYTLWFAAFQLLAVFAHLAREMASQVAPLAYGLLYTGPSYFQILLLAGGIWLHRRRVRRHGPYRSWRGSSPPMPARLRRDWPNV
ncbi:hypothetical protein GCM10011515_19240 [Tsuneonella deserti]|uniref:Uncharacterized protein n=1 Tax=Tsuneonella deserti TaxID=2035528 RepID=A0ABQ1SAT3_9SPHN|nr:hypothetical protein [Tsuneonella deserti]GGD99560.1 hypothetical protein GCM10011515_19240 [Tsuneonella deserti]